MFAKARVRLLADRWTAYSRVVRFVGVDFTGADFALQVRTSRDQVPAPSALANLSKVTTVGAEGVRFVGVTTAAGVPTSELHIVIAKATMAAMDVAADSGLAGSDGTAFYDLVIAPTDAAAFVAMAGEFVIEAGSTQSALTGGTGPGGITVIEIADNGVTVQVDGATVLGQFIEEAEAAVTLAQAWAESPSAPGGVGTKSAKTHATEAAASNTAAAGQVTLAQTARTGAEAARDAALAALGNSLIFATKAAADAALAAVAADAYIMVLADETQAGRAWRYQKVSGSYVSRGAAVNLGPLVVPRGTLSGGAETSEPIRINPPAGSQVNGAAVDDAVTTGMVVTTGQFNAATANSFFDTVLSIGHNMNGSITSRFNAAQPISRIGIESKFQQVVGQPFKSEYHLASLLYPTDAGGAQNEYRALSAVIPHRQADWNTDAASVYMRGNVIAFARGVDGVPVVQLEIATTRLRFTAGYSTLFETNNQPIIRQNNAAGSSALALPFVNNQDRYAFGLPVTGVPVGNSVTASGLRVFTRGWNSSTLQLDAPGSNASTITFRCGATQSASSSITVTCNGTTTITFAANAIVEADVGRFITGTNVPANTRIIDISSTTTAVVSNACPNTVTAVVMSARTQRTATYGLDDGGNLAFGTATNAGIAYFDTWGGVVWRDVQNGYATRMVLNAGATGGLQVNTRVGFNGVAPIARRTVSAAATDLATAITLVNELRQLLIDVGLAQ